ncbi:MAG TPA: thiamine-phosphate kinase [Fibrobacteria bacterium]|nr:thiamine-phosphate kinase [Fibrobacteria bacterium]
MNHRDSAEFHRIARSFPWTTDGRGVGDDAAWVGERGLFCCDALAEDVHFRWDWSSPRDVGYKCVVANVADIVCTGGRPLHAVWSVGMGRDWSDSVFQELCEGALEACQATGVHLVGGDTVRCRDKGFVSLALWGELHDARPWLRSGARAGDQLVVLGSLGLSASGLAALHNGLDREEAFCRLVEVHRRPRPVGMDLPAAFRQAVHAGIDLSDGLSSECEHLARSSGVRLILDLAHLTPDPMQIALGQRLGFDPMEWILHGGEDHSLLLCVDPQAPLPQGVSRIGRIETGSGVWVSENGRIESLPSRAWDHV